MRALLLAALLSSTALAAEPQRILSLGGATTETVFALGAGDRLVGVDQTSVFPDKAKALPQIGYVRTLSAEGILSLKPDLVLAAPEAGPPAALDQARSAGTKIEAMPPGFTLEATLARIVTVGRALGLDDRAAKLKDAVAEDMTTVQLQLAGVKTQPKVLFLLSVGRGAPLVAGHGTAADAMIGLAKGVNVEGAAFDGYKPLSPEALIAAAPDVLLMTDESIEALGGRDAVLALPGIADTPAAKAGRLVQFESLYLAGFGPRLPNAIHDLAAAFHPEARLTPLPHRPESDPA